MAVILKQALKATQQGARAIVVHGDVGLRVELVGDEARLRAAVGETLGVEFDFESVTRWRTLGADDPEKHGLFMESNGDVRVIGAVHHVMRLEGDVALFDVYLQKGPESLTFESADLPGAPPGAGQGIEIIVRGLRAYPTWS